MRTVLSSSFSISVLVIILMLAGCNIYDVPKAGTCTRQLSSSVLTAVDQTQLQKDIAIIEKYLSDNSLTAQKDPTGLFYQITVPGDDSRPCLEKAIAVKYTGKLLATGAIIDSSSEPIPFQLNTLIVGWQIGLLKIGKGASITLYIPSGYAYGKNERTGIPPNSNLIFTIDLVNLQE